MDIVDEFLFSFLAISLVLNFSFSLIYLVIASSGESLVAKIVIGISSLFSFCVIFLISSSRVICSFERIYLIKSSFVISPKSPFSKLKKSKKLSYLNIFFCRIFHN